MNEARGTRRVGLLLALLVVALAAFGIWYFAIRSPEPKDDFERFQGEWQLAVPAVDQENKPAVRLKPVTIRVTGDRWVYVTNGTDQRRYSFSLRPEANPKEIDLVQLAANDEPLIQQWPPPARPVMIRGIYAIEGKQVKIATSIGNEPRPTSLDATESGTVWLLERME